MMGNGMKTKSTAKDYISGRMAGSSTGSGKITTCMAVVSTLGKMVEGTKVNILTIGNMDLVHTLGLTADNTLASGQMENSMERAGTNKQMAKKS